MWLWSKMKGAARKWCFWVVLVGIVTAGGLGLLPTLETILLILAIVILGVACVARSPTPAKDSEPQSD